MNVPCDWSNYKRVCSLCGFQYHASDGGCDTCANNWDRIICQKAVVFELEKNLQIKIAGYENEVRVSSILDGVEVNFFSIENEHYREENILFMEVDENRLLEDLSQNKINSVLSAVEEFINFEK